MTPFSAHLWDLGQRLVEAQRGQVIQVPPALPDHRPCEFCDRVAWVTGTCKDGMTSYMCAAGHVHISAGARDVDSSPCNATAMEVDRSLS